MKKFMAIAALACVGACGNKQEDRLRREQACAADMLSVSAETLAFSNERESVRRLVGRVPHASDTIQQVHALCQNGRNLEQKISRVTEGVPSTPSASVCVGVYGIYSLNPTYDIMRAELRASRSEIWGIESLCQSYSTTLGNQ